MTLTDVETKAEHRSVSGRQLLFEFAPVWAFGVAIAIVLFLVWTVGANPWSALGELASGAFGSSYALGTTAVKTTPLLLTGLAVTIGVRCGVWNLGTEGQVYMGALLATVVLLQLNDIRSGLLLIPVGLVCGFVGGSVWMAIPALLRVFRGVSELITTLLMSFIAINVTTVLIQGPLGKAGSSFPTSEDIPASSVLPILISGTRMHWGIVIAIALSAVAYFVVWKTGFGLEIRTVGQNERAARFAGIPARTRLLQVLLLSGGIGGLAGAVEIMGVHHRLPQGFSPGYGFAAIAVALLARSDPRWIVFAALLFGALESGAPALQRNLGVPTQIADITQALVILSVIVGYGLRDRYRVRTNVQTSA